MNYQGEINAVGGVSSTVAGVAVLPNTGETPLLMLVGVAAIVTGVTLTLLQIITSVHRRFYINK